MKPFLNLTIPPSHSFLSFLSLYLILFARIVVWRLEEFYVRPAAPPLHAHDRTTSRLLTVTHTPTPPAAPLYTHTTHTPPHAFTTHGPWARADDRCHTTLPPHHTFAPHIHTLRLDPTAFTPPGVLFCGCIIRAPVAFSMCGVVRRYLPAMPLTV